jgi:hypothetical protein
MDVFGGSVGWVGNLISKGGTSSRLFGVDAPYPTLWVLVIEILDPCPRLGGGYFTGLKGNARMLIQTVQIDKFGLKGIKGHCFGVPVDFD